MLSTVVCILIKRINPELSFAAAAAAVAVMLLGTVGLIQSLTGLAERARDAMGVPGTLLQPMLKCAGIAATSKLCAELCKDASQGAIAAAVEIAATLCATAVAMPVIMNMLNMIGGMGAYSLEEQITDEEKEISGRLSFDGSYDAGGAIARVWKSFLNNIVSELRDNLSFGATLITIALLCALGGSLCSSKGISEYIEIAGCCGAAMIMLKGVDGIVSQTVESMFRLSDYSKAALPVIFTAAAAGGALTSAGAKFAAVSLALAEAGSPARICISCGDGGKRSVPEFPDGRGGTFYKVGGNNNNDRDDDKLHGIHRHDGRHHIEYRRRCGEDSAYGHIDSAAGRRRDDIRCFGSSARRGGSDKRLRGSVRAHHRLRPVRGTVCGTVRKDAHP